MRARSAAAPSAARAVLLRAAELLPAVREIVAAYRDGTDFGIGMDGEGTRL